MNKKAFTLVELLVVIAIIGLIAALSVIALGEARAKSRDNKRMTDIKQIQTALELFFSDQGRYPTLSEWNGGSLYSTSSLGTSTYIAVIPTPPATFDGPCTASTLAVYKYLPSSDGASYHLGYCLGSNTGSLTKGYRIATPGAIDYSGACGSLIFYGDQFYNTVQIGTQCWMKENLNVGTRINACTGGVCTGACTGTCVGNRNEQTNNRRVEKYCPMDSESYCDIYGGLYLWGEALNYDAPNTQGLCPSGFHVPNNSDWSTLISLDTANTIAAKLKATSTVPDAHPRWLSPNLGATNVYGFSALPAGNRESGNNRFYNLEELARFWASTVNSTSNGYLYQMQYSTTLLGGPHSVSKEFGFSIRCVKN